MQLPLFTPAPAPSPVLSAPPAPRRRRRPPRRPLAERLGADTLCLHIPRDLINPALHPALPPPAGPPCAHPPGPGPGRVLHVDLTNRQDTP